MEVSSWIFFYQPMTREGNEDPLRQNWLGTPMNLAILNGLGYAADFSGGFFGKYTSHLLMYH